MITNQNFVSSASNTLSQPEDVSPSKPVNLIQENKNTTKLGGTLRGRLLMTVLPTALIPLAVASLVGINVTQNRTEEEELRKIEEITISTKETANKFFQDALNISSELEANPFVIQAIKSSAKQVESQGLLKKDIEQIEKQFATSKLLLPNQALNNYLQVMTETREVAEVILTERNGFNVAYSAPTSDFVQSDEQWWQLGLKEGKKVLESTFDDSTNTAVVETVSSLTNPTTGKVFGVVKISVPTSRLDEIIATSVGLSLSDSEMIQVIDGQSGIVLDTLTAKDATKSAEILAEEAVAQATKIFAQASLANNSQDVVSQLQEVSGIANVKLFKSNIKEDVEILQFEVQGRYFKLSIIPDTNFVVVTSVDKAQIAKAGNQLMFIFASTATLLGILAIGAVLLLARNLAQPLTNLAGKAKKVAEGDLDVKAELAGTQETRTLADNFNNLVSQVKRLIQEQQEVVDEQRQEKETLEQGIYQLLEELQGALDGDLTVRASLNSMEMSTVADLFNAIIDSLQDIAIQVKESSTQVSTSLGENEQSIQILAQQAIKEAEETRNTLGAIEQMSHSIKEVATNANQAAILADDAYQETQEGANAMDETVNSILSLRTTVGETAKKMKRLGESSQKISQVVSLIEEIALKTNLLAINASVEASRAGEQGQGFTVVAEQVGALAEQSAEATKEITQIVAAIQAETQEVSQAMELGTTQVIDTNRLVELTKQRLAQVLDTSRSINELMKQISQSTVSQTDTSQVVTKLMQQIAQQSEQRLTSSQNIAQSMQATAQVAKQLESAVEQFEVEK